MDKIKIMSVFGTRPEASKMAPLVLALEKRDWAQNIVCVTAQHREMLDQVLDIFGILPDIDLNIMAHGQTLSDITTKALQGLESVIQERKPDLMLVHGDTTTTFAAGLAGFYQKVQVGHVEAGLRTYDKFQPYPEEMNRMLTTALADIYFSPTSAAKDNLLKENVDPTKIYVTGNTAIDCMATTIEENYHFHFDDLNKIDFTKKIIAVTAHRRENLGQPLKNILQGILKIAEAYPDVEFVYAVHSNPQVKDLVYSMLDGHRQMHLTPPLDLRDMHNLMNRSYFVMTDSGGLQEEVPALNKPVIVLRNVTERPEGLTAGTLRLAGSDRDEIYRQAKILLEDKDAYHQMAEAKNPFGDGLAAERIVSAIGYHFGVIKERPPEYIM